MSAPQPNPNAGRVQGSYPDDVTEWTTRLNETLKDHSHITAPQGTAEWEHGLFECFNPIDTCLMTWCCPCVTFGKTHHRLRRGDVSSWSPLNASCVGFYVASIFGLGCVPLLMQRSEIRMRSNPEKKGDFITDLLTVSSLS